jgi:hypothetical protein
MIDYNHALLLKNIQFLPSNSLIKENQDATQENAMWIQLLQDYRLKPYDAQIAVNNALLLPTKVVTPAFHTYPSTCDARPLCTIPSWQQDLQNGWRTVSQSWARTWHFWFWLIIALLGIFFLLPTRGRIYREISYRVFYNGTLSQFRGVLPSGMRELQKDLQMVEIGLWRSGSQQGRVQNGTIHFDLGPGTTVKDVFVSSAKPPTRWRLKKDLVEQADEEIKAFVDTATGAVVLQLVQWPVSTRSRFGDYFVRLYIVVDYFAGNIDAEAHIPDIERLLDIRGSLSLAALANGLRFLDMLLLSVGISFILLMCSYYFFNGTDLSELFERFALIGVVTFVVLESFVTMLLKSNLKQQKVVSTGL